MQSFFMSWSCKVSNSKHLLPFPRFRVSNPQQKSRISHKPCPQRKCRANECSHECMLSTKHQSFKIFNRQGEEIIGARFLRPFHDFLNLFYGYRLSVVADCRMAFLSSSDFHCMQNCHDSRGTSRATLYFSCLLIQLVITRVLVTIPYWVVRIEFY
jgi:hypothetical protein